MGWGTVIKKLEFPFKRKITLKNLYINKITESELEYQLEDIKDSIEYIKNKLIAISSNTSETVISEESNPLSVIDYVVFEVPRLLNDLEEFYVNKFLLEKALEDLGNTEQDI